MIKKEFDNKLKEINISRKDFAELTKVQYTTVGKWNDVDRKIPGWVESWLENYIEKKKFENMKNVLRDSGVCDG